MTLVLHDVHVLDVTGGFEGPVDVVVEDGLVTAVVRHAVTTDAEVHDGAGRWLIPGVADCHAHITSVTTDMLELLEMPITRWTLEAAHNARAILHGGVTTVRDAGGADAGMRSAITEGLIAGPQLLISCTMLSETGGHGDGYLTGADLEATAGFVIPDFPGMPSAIVDGPEQMRRKIRELVRAGADWIKLAATGGVLSPTDEPDSPQFDLAEMRMAVTEAARKGRRVMAHAVGGTGIDDAIDAGVASIEHGVYLTEEQAVAMAQRDCTLVPTLSALHLLIGAARRGEIPRDSARKSLALEPHVGACVELAKSYGLRIALGSDFMSREQHGQNLMEIDALRRAGLTPQEALLAATVAGHELCGQARNRGRIAPGFVFDAVLLGADPSDTTVFNDPGTVVSVYQSGRLVHTRDEHLRIGVAGAELAA